jgi:hypothetical protein
MPSTAAARSAPEGSDLRQRLAALRRRLRRTAIIRGVSWLLLFTAVVAVAAGFLDSVAPLPSLVRAGILVGWLAGSGVLAWLVLGRPLSERCDDLSLALRIEQRFPTLNDALASTVQFLDSTAGQAGDSASMRREAVKRALGKAEGCDFNRVLNARGLRSACAFAALATAGAAVLVFCFPGPAYSALGRLLNPFNNRDLPPQTVLELDAPRDRIGRNEAFEIHGRVTGVVPPKAFVAVRIDGFPSTEYSTDIARDGDKSGTLSLRLEPGKVQRNFRFQVRANDAVSREYEVKVLPPPVLTALGKAPSPQVQLYFPPYTGLPSPQTQTPGVGSVDAVVGTAVVLRAAADRRLGAAWVEYQPEPKAVLPAACAGPLGARDLASLLSLSAAGDAVWGRVNAVLDDDRKSFSVRFTPRVSGVYVLHFEDETGLGNNRLFDLRLRDDPAPTVQLDRPSKTRDVLNVLPTAELPLQLAAEDPLYGLRSVFLEYRTQPNVPPQQLLLHNPDSAVGGVVAPLAGPAVTALTLPLRPTRLEFRRTLAVASLRRPNGSTLREGDVVQLQACADDWDDLDPFREPGRSHVVDIHIIGRSEFNLTIDQEQTDVQQKLLRLREKELQALQQADEAERRLKKVEKIQPKEDDQSDAAKKQRAEVEKLQKEIGDELHAAQQLQKEIQEGVGDRQEGVRAQAARILESLRSNGMQNSPAADRMDRVEQELDRLAENELQQIDPKLTAAMKEAELLDPKNKEQRKALKEEQARTLEQQAREAEQDAQSRTGAADRAEERAEESRDAAEKARLREEAARERKEAEELRQKAAALRKEAARERDEAGNQTPAAAPRQAVAQAREMQEEVEKTLNDLLGRMEPFSGAREIKSEAGKLLQEQRKLEAEAAELNNKVLGKQPKEMTPEQKGDLDELHDSQKRLEERTQQLLSKMQRMAEERAANDPEAAKELNDAFDKAQQAGLDDAMKQASDELAKAQLSNAQTDQKKAENALQEMVKNFEERRENDLDELAKKLAEKQKELEKLAKDQDELEKKIKDAEAKKNEQELESLGKKEKDLAQEARKVADELTRLGAERAAREAQEAADALDRDAAKLEKGQKPEDEDAALDRLKEAKDEADQAKQDAQDELEREQQARIAEEVQRLKERQESLNQDVALLHGDPARKKNLRSLLTTKDAQKGLAGETEDLAKKELPAAPVLLRVMLRASESMNDAADRMIQDVRDGSVSDETVRAQQDASHRLGLVLDALKSDDQALPTLGEKQGGQPGQPGQPGQNDNAGAQADSVPPLAQLKLLRAMQKEVNDRTAAFQKDHPDATKLTDKERVQLQDIRKEQQDVIDLLDEFRRPPDAGEGDKK